MRVRGRDSRGVPFEEETSTSRRGETDFATQGRVVHVGDRHPQGEKLVGVQFTGPRFQRVFRSESAA